MAEIKGKKALFIIDDGLESCDKENKRNPKGNSKMIERTEEEKEMIALKATHEISKDVAQLWSEGKKDIAGHLLDFLVIADTETLVMFYDIISALNMVDPE